MPHILAKSQNIQKSLNRALDNHIGYLYIQSELYWSNAHGVYRLLVNTKFPAFVPLLANLAPYMEFSAIRGPKFGENQNFQNLLNMV